TYNNKKYDPDDAKKGPKELPMLRFMLDDGTGKMDTVCFPKPDEADKIEFFLSGKAEISEDYAVDEAQSSEATVSTADSIESTDKQDNITPTEINEIGNKGGENNGKEAKEDTQEPQDVYVVCFGRVSKFRDTYSLTANAIFECEINFDSIHADESKPEPAKYVNVFPENCVTLQQQSFIESEEDEINPYFIGKTFVIYDLETTDVAIDKAHVIQIAALKVVDGIEKQTFETFVNPPIAIPQLITELTHIENSDVIGAPTIEEVMPDFFKFTRGAILVGHNICGYDFPITNRLARDMGYIFDNELLDTYPLAKKYMPEMSNFKLTTLSKSLKIEHLSAHRADSDVYATWGVLKEIAKRM
ncbi:MAG: 3'-5' exonuclease, partial [Clostridia bacterium]|nr:3'-5' exonuclease [Clostridia bacterium]